MQMMDIGTCMYKHRLKTVRIDSNGRSLVRTTRAIVTDPRTLMYLLKETYGYPDHRILKAIKASKAAIHGLKRSAAPQLKWRRQRMTIPMIVRTSRNDASTMLPSSGSPVPPGSGTPQVFNQIP